MAVGTTSPALERPRSGLKPCAEKPKPTEGAGCGELAKEKDGLYWGCSIIWPGRLELGAEEPDRVIRGMNGQEKERTQG